MPTSYESRVNALKDAILAALQEDSDPSAAALSILKAASPSSLTHAGGIASLAKPPSASDGVLLYNAVLAAVLHLAGQAAEKKEHVMSLSLGTGDQPTVAHLLDSALWLAGQSPPMLDAGAPAACIEAIVEVCTNAECDGVFAYLDSRLVQFKRPGVMVKSHHTLLRTCNLLLKRLSKSQDAPLCGRVLMFLAKFLPLTERSGVNLTGAFHTENVTPMEDVPEGALDAEGRPVDATFYKTFWGLQQWFADPPAVLAKGKWPEVSRGVRAVLDRFAAVKVTVTEAPPGASLLGAGAGAGASVKYLSSARLLPLQLRDATFRRHFLIQCLVLMSWVERPLLKDWVAKAAKGKVLDDLQELQAAVYKALEATPEHGAEFTAAIRAMMAEENAWAVWKQAGCPAEPLQVAPLAPLPAVDIDDLAPPPKRPRPGPEAVYGVRVGPEELNRLWNLTEDNLSTLGADDRGGFRTLRQLMEPVIEEMNEDPDEVDEEMRASKNAIYSWKTLRMVARDSLPAFAAAVRKGGDLRVAARALYPDEVPPEPEPEVKVDSEAKPQGTAEGGAAGEGGARPDASADAGEGAGIAVEVEMTEAEDGEADTGAHDSGGNRDEGAGRSGDEGEGAAPSGGDAGGDDPDNEAGVGNEDSEGGALRGEVEASP